MDALKLDAVVPTVELTKAFELEQFLHRQFTDKRLLGSEYFRLTEEEVQEAIAVCIAYDPDNSHQKTSLPKPMPQT